MHNLIYRPHIFVMFFFLLFVFGCKSSGSGSTSLLPEDDVDIPTIQPPPTLQETPTQETPAQEPNNTGSNQNSGSNNRNDSSGQLTSFPGATGFGAFTTGGRGGRVIKVNNLNATGAGSLQDALNQNEPRIIIFNVSGVITADIINIPYGNVTIAGQTAPGAGITIEGRLYGAYSSSVKNIIIRHIKVRPPVFNSQSPGNQFDAVQLSRNTNIILDHVSMSFGVDETLDLYSAKDVTVQWCTIEQSATNGHPKGNHNYGLISGPNGGRISILNNLFAHHNRRAPSISTGPSETINNVIYNVKDGWLHSGNKASGQHIISNNYFKRGPNSDITPIFLDAGSAGKNLRYYINSNYVDDPGNLQGVIEPWETNLNHPSLRFLCSYFQGPDCKSFRLNNRPTFGSNILAANETDHTTAYNNVLERSGAFPRDVVTKTTVEEVRSRSGTWGARIPSNLLQGLQVSSPPLDTDNDGMPDSWENNNGLDLTDASDQHKLMSTGYPAIEQYINEVADNLVK